MTPSGKPPVFGTITLDGIQYIERPQIFALEVTITTANQVLTNQRLTLPGFADFLLKSLTRIAISGVVPPPNFRFRLLNGAGSTSFKTGALDIFDDRIVDNAIFGTGQFPYPLIPPIPVHSSGSLLFEVEDISQISNPGFAAYPYTIYFGFHGSYLIPAEQAA